MPTVFSATLQELEKFKFVLEYSIGELRGQLDPKAAELADMRDKVAVSDGAAAAVLEGCMPTCTPRWR